jgi:hypothetical protein
VVYDVVSGPQKFGYCFVQKCGVVAVHVEFDRDSSPHLHTPDVCPILYKYQGERGGNSAWTVAELSVSSPAYSLVLPPGPEALRSLRPDAPPRNC